MAYVIHQRNTLGQKVNGVNLDFIYLLWLEYAHRKLESDFFTFLGSS